MSAQAPDSPAKPPKAFDAEWKSAKYDTYINVKPDQARYWFERGVSYGELAAPLPAAPAPTENFKQFDGYACRGVAEAIASQPVAALPAEQVPTEPTTAMCEAMVKEAAYQGKTITIDGAVHLYRAALAALAARQAPAAYRWPSFNNWLASPISPPESPLRYAMMAFDAGRATMAARQVVAPEVAKEPTPVCWIDPIELRELENGVAMVTPDEGNAQRIPLFRQAPARPVVDGAVELDAKRYRWLRDRANNGFNLKDAGSIWNWNVSQKISAGSALCFVDENLDAQLDFTMAQEKAS